MRLSSDSLGKTQPIPVFLLVKLFVHQKQSLGLCITFRLSDLVHTQLFQPYSSSKNRKQHGRNLIQFFNLFFNSKNPSDNQQQSPCHRMHGDSKGQTNFLLGKAADQISKLFQKAQKRFSTLPQLQKATNGTKRTPRSLEFCTNVHKHLRMGKTWRLTTA
jgi:hypothetical protein